VVQVVADEDVDPMLDEESELVDAEHPSAPPLIADDSVVRAYRERVERLGDDLRDFCTAHRLPWLQLRSSATFEAVLGDCVDAGLLAVHA
jgi:hypothetical protein